MVVPFAKLYVLLSILSADCYASLLAVDHSDPRLRTRATYSENSISNGGVLFIDGKQTSCEIVTIDNKASIVSARCLKFKNGNVDKSYKYEVYIYSMSPDDRNVYTVEKITSHPNFDPNGYQNNIAILEYNFNSSISWHTNISVDRNEWDGGILFGRHNLKGVNPLSWDKPTLVTGPAEESLCKPYSRLFTDNPTDYLCNNITMKSMARPSCQAPYGSVYGIIDSNIYPVGLYSHTAVSGGKSLCDYTKMEVYYTLIMHYHAFASAVIGRAAYYYKDAKTVIPKANSSFQMKLPTTDAPKDVNYVTGDFYARQGGIPQLPDSSESGPSPSSSDLPGAPSASPTVTSSASASNGLSQKATIIISVCASVGGVLLIIGLFLLIKWLRKRRFNRTWDPRREVSNINLVAYELGSASVAHQDNGRFSGGGDILDVGPNYSDLPAYTSVVREQQPGNSSASEDKK